MEEKNGVTEIHKICSLQQLGSVNFMGSVCTTVGSHLSLSTEALWVMQV